MIIKSALPANVIKGVFIVQNEKSEWTVHIETDSETYTIVFNTIEATNKFYESIVLKMNNCVEF